MSSAPNSPRVKHAKHDDRSTVTSRPSSAREQPTVNKEAKVVNSCCGEVGFRSCPLPFNNLLLCHYSKLAPNTCQPMLKAWRRRLFSSFFFSQAFYFSFHRWFAHRQLRLMNVLFRLQNMFLWVWRMELRSIDLTGNCKACIGRASLLATFGVFWRFGLLQECV